MASGPTQLQPVNWQPVDGLSFTGWIVCGKREDIRTITCHQPPRLVFRQTIWHLIDRRNRVQGTQAFVHRQHLWKVMGQLFKHIQRNVAEGCQFTSRNGQQSLFLPDSVLATFFRWIRILPMTYHGSHTGKCRTNILLCQSVVGEVRLDSSQKIGNFIRCDPGFFIKICSMIKVGCAQQRDALPGKDKDRAAIIRMGKRHGLV